MRTDLPPPVNHVFVDCENVHSIDLAMFGSATVHLTLLLGRQTKLSGPLVEELLQHAATLELVRLTSSGRNALDFALVYYLGRSVLADPAGSFHIVSKDGGYDPLIEHLCSKRINVRRLQDLAAAPPSALGDSNPTSPEPRSATPRPKSPAKSKTPLPAVVPLGETEQRVLEHFRKPSTTRPRTQTRLLKFLVAFHGQKLTVDAVSTIISKLSQSGHLSIDPRGKVLYHLNQPQKR